MVKICIDACSSLRCFPLSSKDYMSCDTPTIEFMGHNHRYRDIDKYCTVYVLGKWFSHFPQVIEDNDGVTTYSDHLNNLSIYPY